MSSHMYGTTAPAVFTTSFESGCLNLTSRVGAHIAKTSHLPMLEKSSVAERYPFLSKLSGLRSSRRQCNFTMVDLVHLFVQDVEAQNVKPCLCLLHRQPREEGHVSKSDDAYFGKF